MTFLKKLGQVILRGTEMFAGVSPLIPPQYKEKTTSVVDTLGQVGHIIVSVEAFGQTLNIAGADKLKAAAPLVAQIILASDMLTGKKIDDPVKFLAGVTKITDGMADIINSLDDKVDTVNKA